MEITMDEFETFAIDRLIGAPEHTTRHHPHLPRLRCDRHHPARWAALG